MGSLGTRLHQDCNGMVDTAEISPHVLPTLSLRSVGSREDMILPGHEDPRNLAQSEWEEKFGKIKCEFSMYHKRRWKWDDVYLLRGLPNIYSPSLSAPPLPQYLCITVVAPWRCTWLRMFELHLVTEIERTERCTWRQRSSEFGDALGDHGRVNLQAIIEWVWRYTWRPRSSELRRCIWKPWSIEFGDASEAVTERVWRRTCRLWSSEIGRVVGGGQFGGRPDGSWDSMYWLTCNCGNVERWVQHPPRDEKLAGSRRLSIMAWCYTWCMPYSVSTHDHVMERQRGLT